MLIDDLPGWSRAIGPADLQRVLQKIWKWNRLGVVSEGILDALFDDCPALASCVSREALFDRLRRTTAGRVSSTLAKFAPELQVLYDHVVAELKARQLESVELAISWLTPIAEEALDGVELEAAVCLASRDKWSGEVGPIVAAWYDAIQRKGQAIAPPDADRSNMSHKTAAAHLLTRGSGRFLSFLDQEEPAVDAVFLRAVEWLGITGFDEWVDHAVAFLSDGPDGAPDGTAAMAFFHFLRSDLALQRARRAGLETWLWRWANEARKGDHPWHGLVPKHGPPVFADFLPTASVLLFGHARIGPVEENAYLINSAVEVLARNQLPDGGWPVWSSWTDASLYSTVAAVHGLACARPREMSSLLRRAAHWLEKNQDPLGPWDQSWGNQVLDTSVALDALSLARNSGVVSFSVPETSAESRPPQMETFDVTEQPWHNPPTPQLKSWPRAEAPDTVDLLLVVANPTEQAQAAAAMRPLKSRRKIGKVIVRQHTYLVGRFGAYTAALVRCRMGTGTPRGAELAVADSIQAWRPRAVVMPGVAFGMNPGKHRPGDVLVAEWIIPYDMRRVGSKSVDKAPRPAANATLIERLEAPDWGFTSPFGGAVKRHVGAVLSGPKLVDNAEFKAELADAYPEAIGGEMEGAGLWAGAVSRGVAWVLAKGVCDWADGEKHDGFQEFAAAASVSLFKHVFQDVNALSGLTRPRAEESDSVP